MLQARQLNRPCFKSKGKNKIAVNTALTEENYIYEADVSKGDSEFQHRNSETTRHQRIPAARSQQLKKMTLEKTARCDRFKTKAFPLPPGHFLLFFLIACSMIKVCQIAKLLTWGPGRPKAW